MAQLGLYACETCPADCDAAAAPAFDINDCAEAIEFYESEISDFFFTGVDATDCTVAEIVPVAWTSGANWASVIANTGALKIRRINVIGDMPLPEATNITFSKGRIKNGLKTFTQNITIDEYNPTNYTAMRLLECGYTGFAWFQTRGGLLYGGQTGIKFTVTSIGAPKERGENVYERIEMVIQWQSRCSPAMIVSPIVSVAC